MASRTSKAEPGEPVIRMADLAARISARRAERGNPEQTRNAGQNRTPSKRALLKAIEEAGGKW
jgi:hypothetical protein